MNAMTKPSDTWMPAPRDFAEAVQMAEWLARSSLVPDSYRGKPADLLIVADFGRRLGLPLLTALQGIAVINGKPTVWGDCQLALCRRHPAFGGMTVTVTGEGDRMVATCSVDRMGEQPTVRRFSMAEARAAGLTHKGPWKTYPARMLSMRARSWALRDAFADALLGIGSAEEIIDTGPGTVPLERVLDADELPSLTGDDPPMPKAKACVECGDPVTSAGPRAQRCEAHIEKKGRRARKPEPTAAAEAEPVAEAAASDATQLPEAPSPATLAERMAAATTIEQLTGIGREASAAVRDEPTLEHLRGVYARRARELAGSAAPPGGGDGAGVAALRARQAARGTT